MAQRVKNLPAIQQTKEMQVRSLGWEDPLAEEMATHSSILAWEIHEQRSLVGCSPCGHKETNTTECLSTCSTINNCKLDVFLNASLFFTPKTEFVITLSCTSLFLLTLPE